MARVGQNGLKADVEGLTLYCGAGGKGNQNFKLYGWEDIAGERLPIDTTWSPRTK